jgi:hypothetical protein
VLTHPLAALRRLSASSVPQLWQGFEMTAGASRLVLEWYSSIETLEGCTER